MLDSQSMLGMMTHLDSPCNPSYSRTDSYLLQDDPGPQWVYSKVTTGLVQRTEWRTSGIMITMDLRSRNEGRDELYLTSQWI